MLHLRIISPRDRTGAVLDALRGEPAVADLVLLAGASLMPTGDLVLCDVAREGANSVIEALRGLNIHHDGSIAVEQLEASLGDAAAAAERRAPGYASDAAVWEEVDARVREDSELTAGFLIFIIVAALIAAVGLFQDAPILIVGAMAVGPEFGPLAGLSVGLFKRQPSTLAAALKTLSVGLGVAAASALVATGFADAINLVPEGFAPEAQPLTGFIVDPSFLSFGVAFLAGIAGTLSLTLEKTGTLVGVLISVTTIPAIAAIGMSGALGNWDNAAGATVQLALNLVALTLAGVLTLTAQHSGSDRLGLRSRR